MDKTRIEWCDATFNPVTGCLHSCEYCYARKMATRFGTLDKAIESAAARGIDLNKTYFSNPDFLAELNEPVRDENDRREPYPYNFLPTFHKYLLNKPSQWTKSRVIFVCSMADLFGEWIPDEWIEAVFDACAKAPQHKYLFLTKNPKRYSALAEAGKLPQSDNMWYGTTATTPNTEFFFANKFNTFLSIEPILEDFGEKNDLRNVNWLIIGAESGVRKNKVVPEKAWIENICNVADKTGIPVFMKESLLPIMGETAMRREFPWKNK